MSRRPEDSYILEKVRSYGDEDFYKYVKMALEYYKQDVSECKEWINVNLPVLIMLDKENARLQGLLREAHVKMEANNLWSNLRNRVAAAIRERENDEN